MLMAMVISKFNPRYYLVLKCREMCFVNVKNFSLYTIISLVDATHRVVNTIIRIADEMNIDGGVMIRVVEVIVFYLE